jgi:hypothetical protein
MEIRLFSSYSNVNVFVPDDWQHHSKGFLHAPHHNLDSRNSGIYFLLLKLAIYYLNLTQIGDLCLSYTNMPKYHCTKALRCEGVGLYVGNTPWILNTSTSWRWVGCFFACFPLCPLSRTRVVSLRPVGLSGPCNIFMMAVIGFRNIVRERNIVLPLGNAGMNVRQ